METFPWILGFQSCFPWNSRGWVLPTIIRTRKNHPWFNLMGSVSADIAVNFKFFFFHFPVKPLPPSNVGAELTRNVGLLNVSWTKPVFASRDLTFQIRWNSGNRQEIPWQVLAAPPGLEQRSLLCCPVGWSCFLWNLSTKKIKHLQHPQRNIPHNPTSSLASFQGNFENFAS